MTGMVAGVMTMMAVVAAPRIELLDDPGTIMALVESGAVAPHEVPDPHWHEARCHACHGEGEPRRDNLHDQDANRLCSNCHASDLVEAYIHPVGMVPPEDFLQRMPDGFRQSLARNQGVVSCITCHDLPMQCDQQRTSERAMNPRFFRDGPHASRTDLCFNCHEQQQYERFNPHDQITDEGVLDTTRCYVCHSSLPDREKAQGIDDVEFNVVQELTQLCTGCHPWRNHPGGSWAGFRGKGPNHLVIPSETVQKQLARQEALGKKVTLPLDPVTGKITCATCHNPHERGVQFNPRADLGADGVRRLRQGSQEICFSCHNK